MAVTTIYAACAIIGGIYILLQIVLPFVGAEGGDGDFDVDVAGDFDALHDDSSWFFGVLSIRTVVAALTFFGLVGLAGQQSGWAPPVAFIAALGAGAAALFGVYWIMQGMNKLKSDGTARVEQAVGCSGTVYLRIPGAKAGSGKVHVSQQGRTMEYEAMTLRDPLPAGTPVVVVNVVGPDCVEVEAASDA